MNKTVKIVPYSCAQGELFRSVYIRYKMVLLNFCAEKIKTSDAVIIIKILSNVFLRIIVYALKGGLQPHVWLHDHSHENY